MATIKPFACVRPAVDAVAKVAALPYDVFNEEEAKQEVKNNPCSFLAVDRAETCFEETINPHDPKVYEMARQQLQRMKEQNILMEDTELGYYMYQLVMEGREQTGIVACASVDDYLHGVIKKHENTRADKEEDRVKHVTACEAQTGPIFLAYRANEVLHSIMNQQIQNQPLYSFVSEDGIGHRVWKLSEPQIIEQITKTVASMKDIYIADGHHRAAAAVRVACGRRENEFGEHRPMESDYFLSVLFPDDQLKILPYNRCVKDLNGRTVEQFLQAVKEQFVCEPSKTMVRPFKKGVFGMYIDGMWYKLSLKKDTEVPKDSVSQLDVSMLQEFLLKPILGIVNPRTDERIEFIGGIRGEEELVKRVEEGMAVAFSMYPTSIAELFAVADEGRLMPPKSTWFEPKLRSGLFIHKI